MNLYWALSHPSFSQLHNDKQVIAAYSALPTTNAMTFSLPFLASHFEFSQPWGKGQNPNHH